MWRLIVDRIGFLILIVDSPPVLAVRDAIILSGVVGANLIGTLFNAMPLRRSDRRGRGYAYAYTHQGDSGVPAPLSGA